MKIKFLILCLIFFSCPLQAKNSSGEAELGKILFFDKRLSINNSISCQSCHNISASSKYVASGTDNLALSIGVFGRRGKRNAPTVWNSSQRESLFWDGRARSLVEQASGPILNHDEMGMSNMQDVVNKLSKIKGYKTYFKQAYGDSNITPARIVESIAAFEKLLLSKNSPFDRFLNGDEQAITQEARSGWKKFSGYGCIACHGAATFLDQDFFVRFPVHASVEYEEKYDIKSDKGRFEVTRNHVDMNRWRVPSLRNVELTGPYLHNGSVKELEEVVRLMGKLQLYRDLTEADVQEITLFLKSLTGDIKPISSPKMPY